MPAKHLNLERIISGGQTGVDRAGLDVAIRFGLPHGGWCPAGRRAEDGPIDTKYQLQETESRNYAIRTKKNVIESDGTLILHSGQLSGGTLLTKELAVKNLKPLLCVDLAEQQGGAVFANGTATHDFQSWLNQNKIRVLNIAGPRESTQPGIYQLAVNFLSGLLRNDL